MAKKYTNALKFAAAMEVRAGSPLDDRSVVDTYESLLDAKTWKSADGVYYHYNGMLTVVSDTGDVYVYTGASGNLNDILNPDKWKKQGSGDVLFVDRFVIGKSLFTDGIINEDKLYISNAEILRDEEDNEILILNN